MSAAQILFAAISPSLLILGVLWKFNNNVVKSNVALIAVIDKVKEHDHKIENHGFKISELIGAANARIKINERITPLS